MVSFVVCGRYATSFDVGIAPFIYCGGVNTEEASNRSEGFCVFWFVSLAIEHGISLV